MRGSTGSRPRAQHRPFRPAGSWRAVSAHAVQSQAFLGDCPPHARQTVDAIREAVAHSTCAPYSDMAADDTLVINPPWAPQQRSMVRSNPCCSMLPPEAFAGKRCGDPVLCWQIAAHFAAADLKGSKACHTLSCGKASLSCEDLCGDANTIDVAATCARNTL